MSATKVGWGLTKLSPLLVCLLVSSPAWGMDLALTGAWTLSSGPGEVVAGSDLPSSYESTSGEMAAAVFNTTGADDAWRVDISGTGTSWPAALHLFARRTGDGLGAGAIQDGTGYQELSAISASFFSGAGDRTDIPLQLKLTGVSIQIAPGEYRATVMCTVGDL